jgi:hypothetical protein
MTSSVRLRFHTHTRLLSIPGSVFGNEEASGRPTLQVFFPYAATTVSFENSSFQTAPG